MEYGYGKAGTEEQRQGFVAFSKGTSGPDLVLLTIGCLNSAAELKKKKDNNVVWHLAYPGLECIVAAFSYLFLYSAFRRLRENWARSQWSKNGERRAREEREEGFSAT